MGYLPFQTQTQAILPCSLTCFEAQGTAEAVAGLSSDFTPVWSGNQCLRAKPRSNQAGGVIVPPSPLTVLPWQVPSALYLILMLAGFISAVHPQHWYKDAFLLPHSFLKAQPYCKQNS